MLTRRRFTAATVAAGTIASFGAPAAAVPGDLSVTRYVDHDTAAIRQSAAMVTAGLASDRDRAVALFRFVRDQVKFGFAAGFWDMSASDVLTTGRGYCNTKSTLFVALLRATGIPARQVFVEIDPEVLRGMIDPGTPWLDHSYTEVFLDGAWHATDAYIPDPALFQAAVARLRQEKRRFGYGVHVDGQNDWDGASDSFAQYNRIDPVPVGRRVWGVYADVGAFYDRAEGTHNRLNGLLRAGFGVLAGSANRTAEALRASG